MAQSVNKAIIIGHLGQDPDVRSSNSGSKIVSFSVATSETWKDKSGEKQERTEWHRIVIFNPNLADVAEKYLKKGSKVYIEGQMQTRKWTDKENIERYTTEIVLGNFKGEISLLDNKGQGGAPAANTPPPASAPDDEIPF